MLGRIKFKYLFCVWFQVVVPHEGEVDWSIGLGMDRLHQEWLVVVVGLHQPHSVVVVCEGRPGSPIHVVECTTHILLDEEDRGSNRTLHRLESQGEALRHRQQNRVVDWFHRGEVETTRSVQTRRWFVRFGVCSHHPIWWVVLSIPKCHLELSILEYGCDTVISGWVGQCVHNSRLEDVVHWSHWEVEANLQPHTWCWE